MDNNKRSAPMRGGPGPKMGGTDKPENFGESIKRLFGELKDFKIFIIIALILAVLSSILSILTPNKLSDLTDEISKGLVINQDNMEELSSKITENIQNNMSSTMAEQSKIYMQEENANVDMQTQFDISSQEIPENFDMTNQANIDKDSFDISDFSNISNISNISEDMIEVLFTEIEIDGETITPKEQYEFLSTMSDLSEDATAKEIYAKIDKLPESIQNVIKPVMNIDTIKNITILLIILYVCSAVFSFVQSIIMADVANKFARSLRSRISVKINKLPLKYFDKHQTGDTLSRVTNDVDTIAQTMNHSLGSLVSAVVLFLGTIIMMFYTNWIMAITAILSSLVGFAGMMMILKNSQKYFDVKQRELGNLNGHIEEIYSGLNVVKVYNGKEESTKKFREYNQKLCTANRKSQFLSGIMQPLMGFIGNFGYVAVCIVGAILAKNDVITFGVIVAFMTYVRLFTSPLSQIAQGMTQLQSTAAASERVFEFLDEKEMSDQKEITKELDKSKVKGKIEFNNVVFQYDDNPKPTINGFTAVAEAGQKIAIVGPTGAGKTTMVNLLMKFYEINSGSIKIDGVPISELSRENIHTLFTMVLQDTWLFEGTVRENIKYNRDEVSDSRIEEVCKEVGLDHFIRTLPNGYNSLISDSDSVSSGQRQLLTIARGMVEDAPFLILDEATSNVDTRTEELIQKAMDKLTKGRTSFIIAHRLSTIKNADLILVMKEGNIIEQGNHEELMKQNGFYAELYNSQFQLV